LGRVDEDSVEALVKVNESRQRDTIRELKLVHPYEVPRFHNGGPPFHFNLETWFLDASAAVFVLYKYPEVS